jgi:hypothetical protein
MLVFTAGEQPLLPPNACLICEETPLPGIRVVDTMRVLTPDLPVPMAGRKYVCERCALDLAHLMGYESLQEVEIARAESEHYKRAFSNLRYGLEAFTKDVIRLGTAAPHQLQEPYSEKQEVATAGPNPSPVRLSNGPYLGDKAKAGVGASTGKDSPSEG